MTKNEPIITSISNARVFDGERVMSGQNVIINGDRIQAIGEAL